MKLYQIVKKTNNLIIDLGILSIFFTGLINIINIMPIRYMHLKTLHISSAHANFIFHMISIHKALSTIIGFILIFISYRLYKRMKVAYIIILCILPIMQLLDIIKYRNYINLYFVIHVVQMIVLILNYKEFNKESDPISFKKGISIALSSFSLVLLNATFNLYILKKSYLNIHTFKDSFIGAMKLIVYMDSSVLMPTSKIARVYADAMISIIYISIIISVVLILKPLIYQRVISNVDRVRVRKLLNEYAHNPISYVCVEKDKKYFFGKSVDGVISYDIYSSVAVCSGEPICKDEDITILLSEFMSFCKIENISICFCQTTDKFLNEFKAMKFGTVKYGEEAMFDLNTYNIEGKKGAKIRQAINNANKHNIRIIEYKPLEKKNLKLEKEINDISKEWLLIKKSSELSFMLGSISLENPMDRRYFLALDENNNGLGFVVFVPFMGKKGYYADVTRRRKDAPIGVMEKIMISAFEEFKKENLLYSSLGLAPLYNVRDTNEKQVAPILLDFVYENLNRFYGFKTLYQYKKKYSPSFWENRYLVYYPAIFTPKIAYSILKAQNPKGVKDYIFAQIKNIYNSKNNF